LHDGPKEFAAWAKKKHDAEVKAAKDKK